MRYSSHVSLVVNSVEECRDDDLSGPAPSQGGDKITPDPDFDAWANLAEVIFTINDLKSAEGRAAIEFVDRTIEQSHGQLGMFSPAAWREAFRRHQAARAGGRHVRHAGHAGHARARRVASARSLTASGGGDDGGGASGDPDPAGFEILLDVFYDARAIYVAFGGREPDHVEALQDSVSALAAYNGWDLTLDAQVAAADCLREDAEEFGDDLLQELSDALAPGGDFPERMRTLSEAWRAYRPHAALSGLPPTAEARAALRRATAEARDAAPRCPSELGRKAKAAAIVGINALVRRSCPRPDPCAVRLYEHFLREVKPIPPWFFAEALGCWDADLGPRRETFIAEPGLIEELLDVAGPTWTNRLAADVERLRPGRP